MPALQAGAILAYWYFVSGEHAKELIDRLAEKTDKEGHPATYLDDMDFKSFAATLGPNATFKLQQRAGDKVVVPPGWIHWVITVLPCVKVAWEIVEPESLADCVLIWRDIIPQLLKNDQLQNAEDYTAVLSTVTESVLDAMGMMNILSGRV